MKCSFYKSATDNIGIVVDVVRVLSDIKGGKWQDQILRLRELGRSSAVYDDYKKGLPGVTFSGIFSPSRAAVNVQEYNHLVVFDVDKMESRQLMLLKDSLKQDPHILCCFVSPSGDGLKGLIPVTSDVAHHLDAFETVKTYFETNYATILDASGKDVSRICFVSYDPDTHYNPKALPIQVQYSEESRKSTYGERTLKGGITNDDRVKYEVARRWSEFYRPYNDGNRNNHIFLCACNMNRVGIELERAIALVLSDRTDMPVKEIRETVSKVYQSKRDEFNTITIYDFEQEQEAQKGAFETQDLSEMFDMVMTVPVTDGATTFDERIDAALGGGFQPGNVYAFVGREGSYKSVMAVGLAHANAAEKGIPVVYANGEMSAAQFMRYVIRQRLGVDISKKEMVTPDVQRQVKDMLATDLKHFKVINDRDFNEENLLATIDAERKKAGRDVGLLIVDGINHMEDKTRDEIRSIIMNSKIIKEISKKANEGRGVAVIILIHTDAKCMFWDRQPQHYIRGKGSVMRNFDASFGFSRYVTADSFSDGSLDNYELRKDMFHLRVEDRRATGEIVDVVISIDSDLCIQMRHDLDSKQFEVIPDTKGGYQ